MKFSPKAAVVLAMISALDCVMAGAGAYVYACVNLAIDPSEPFEVHFSPHNSENHCMLHIGHDHTTTVTSAGLSCGWIGFVESKASSTGGDLCGTDTSKWFLSYNTTTQGGAKSGTIESYWYMGIIHQNAIILHNYPRGSQICGSKELCGATQFHYGPDATCDAFFIFQPYYSKSANQFIVQPDYSESANIDSFDANQFIVRCYPGN